MGARLRLADLLCGLSIVADLGFGLPLETAMRSCIIGTALARRMRLAEPDVAEVLYVSLLFHVGCVAYSHETAALFVDDLVVNQAVVKTNLADLGEIFSTLIPQSTRGLPPADRVRGTLRMTARGQAFGKAHDQASCEVARAVSRRIGLPDGVSDGLYDIHEWWDGRGARHVHGEHLALSARVARVATEASVLAATGGADSVARALQRRAGKTLDPSVVEQFSSASSSLLATATSEDPRTLLCDTEPTPVIEIPDSALPAVAAAFGDLADVKTPYTHGHSTGVARLSVAAAERLGMSSTAVGDLQVAALLHDLGRVGVSNRIWEKPGPLTGGEWEKVRLHPYYSERILASANALAPLAETAGMHHERLDGSGYHRACRGADITIGARVLAAADTFQAMTEERPHRPALSFERASDELLAGARAGRLDPDVVSAVLDGAGQPHRRERGTRPARLSDREIEVLRLVAAGCSNREVGHRLGISSRTAEHHVQHIYTKVGVSTRAAAALFALEHDLLASP